MSRRKQAKPRAVLKHDTDEDLGQQKDINLLEATKRTKKMSETIADDDDDDVESSAIETASGNESEDDQNLNEKCDTDTEQKKDTSKNQNCKKGQIINDGNKKSSNNLKIRNRNVEENQKEILNESKIPSLLSLKMTFDSSKCDKENLQDIHDDNGNDDVNDGTDNNHEVIMDNEEIANNVEDDSTTTDSFYSDLYSSHTSSRSYSPSMSEEGATTPNSLIHHHHHHLHHTMLHHSPKLELTINENEEGDDGNNNHLRNHRRLAEGEGINSDKNCGNENDESGYNENEQRVDSITSHHHAHRRYRLHNTSTSNNNNDNNSTEDDNNVTDKIETNEGDCKIPLTKIRKIDKNDATLKCASTSNKLTGDGIKPSKASSSNNSDGCYQCQFCDKSFPRLGYLKKHEQSHAEHLPFKCEYCARLFKHKRSRDRHTKLHTGDRRYRCPHCEAAFSRSDHLKIHMKTHDNQKPFQCTVCNRGYNTAAALTSHMQNHKKQAALLASGGVSALNYSPRSTGSGSSSGSFQKRRYITATDSSPNHMICRKNTGRNPFISCIYCTKSDFTTLEQLNNHIQTMHENIVPAKEMPPHSNSSANGTPTAIIPTTSTPVFQLSCEYCTMKFPNIPTMFQHMRTTHIDRLTSPNSYFEHFNRLAASGTFSPRLVANSASTNRYDELMQPKVKIEESSPKSLDRSTELVENGEEQLSPTDLSQPKRRSQTPQVANEAVSSGATDKPGTFLCNQCNAALPDFESFRTHLKTHITQGNHAATNLICHHCGISVRDQQEYERHVISHFLLTSSEFSCGSNCNKVYTKPDELQKHLFDIHVLTVYKCSICSEVFDTKVAIQVHFACVHSKETKIFRCSSCMESFNLEKDFISHIRTRHSNVGTSIQCMFCRAVCSSELEMHFHLAAHARQFRCPACPETFHVEFLLDRHMQTHHSQKDITNGSPGLTYHSQHYGKTSVGSNNNNILDYHAITTGKNLFQLPSNKFYNPLQIDTNSNKHAALMYGLGQRYFDTSKTILDMYNNYHHQDNKINTISTNYFISPTVGHDSRNTPKTQQSQIENKSNDRNSVTNASGFSCGICERNDFRTEAEVHSHRKIVHNLKTGVSLKCAYCSGNFKSRSELEHHMKTCHNSTGKHKCLICDEIFPSPAILAEHKLQHSKVGQSGKCSHCSAVLNDIAAFKSHLSDHNVEGQIPVQCICCRQTLNSDFEISLHAKFHTKSSRAQDNVCCALCLEPLPLTTDMKVCEKCCRKHNLANSKFPSLRHIENPSSSSISAASSSSLSRIHLTSVIENRCNLCKMILPNPQRLQEHLVEHSFLGCEERGYTCYICSSVFTVPTGLLSHMIDIHGPNTRPYDCNYCTEKFFFKAELENHLADHEQHGNFSVSRNSNNENMNISGRINLEVGDDNKLAEPSSSAKLLKHQDQSVNSSENNSHQAMLAPINGNDKPLNASEIKTEVDDEVMAEEEDEEYIEVEKIAESSLNMNNNGSNCENAGDKNRN